MLRRVAPTFALISMRGHFFGPWLVPGSGLAFCIWLTWCETQKQNVPDSSESWDVRSNSPPPKSAQPQCTKWIDGREWPNRVVPWEQRGGLAQSTFIFTPPESLFGFCRRFAEWDLASVADQIQKRLMNARVVGKFGVERCGHDSSLPDGDRVVAHAFGSDDIDVRADALYFRGANENHFERLFTKSSFADRAVDLASVGVAADADVDRA